MGFRVDKPDESIFEFQCDQEGIGSYLRALRPMCDNRTVVVAGESRSITVYDVDTVRLLSRCLNMYFLRSVLLLLFDMSAQNKAITRFTDDSPKSTASHRACRMPTSLLRADHGALRCGTCDRVCLRASSAAIALRQPVRIASWTLTAVARYVCWLSFCLDARVTLTDVVVWLRVVVYWLA